MSTIHKLSGVFRDGGYYIFGVGNISVAASSYLKNAMEQQNGYAAH